MRPIIVAGHDDDLDPGPGRPYRFECGEALGSAVRVRRQSEVEDDDRRPIGRDAGERAVAVARSHDLVIGEGPAQLTLKPRVVLDEQQFVAVAAHRAALARGPSAIDVAWEGK